MDPMIILEWLLIIFLVSLSGLFSGLNLGLMSLDPIGLQIVMASDNAKNRAAATKIQPLRKHGNWLLCTLLIGNVAVNSALSILLADKTTGTIGFFISVCTITIFGEIIPQALCSRYALEIGAKTIWIVWPLMWLMAIIAYPVAYLLDKVLGDELGTVYSNKELQKLVDIHAEIEGTGVSGDTAGMLKGALGLKDALVLNCMTEMKDVFWLNDESKLSFDVLTEIFKSGHSRIPIFNTQDKFGRIACVGLLYVKDLILLDPDDEMPVTQIMNAFKHKTPPIVWKDDTLQHLLKVFVKTSQHLAFVQDVVTNKNKHSNTIAIDTQTDNTYEYVGIITLEDVIEHVLQTQLIDEHDNFVDNKHMLRTNRHIDWNMLHIFDHRQRVLTTLPPQELQAVFHFLSQTIKPFTPKNRLVSEASIKNLLATSSVIRVVVHHDDQVVNSKFGRRIDTIHTFDTTQSLENTSGLTQRDPYKDIEDNGLLLYERDKKTKYFTLLLDGKCEIYAGRQGFRCELTRWSYLCPHALDHCVECFRYNKPILDYVPDFTAKIIENSRVLRMKLDDFRACLEGKFDFDSKIPASPMEHHLGQAKTRKFGFGNATRGSLENEYDEYEYPNTYHLAPTHINPNKKVNDNEHHHHHNIDAIKQIFLPKKLKKNLKQKRSYNSVPTSSNNTDSDNSSNENNNPHTHRHRHHSHHHHHAQAHEPSHPHVSQHHSDPIISHNSPHNNNYNNNNNDSVFNEYEPIKHSMSEPHIITQLPTPTTISDNSAQERRYNAHNVGDMHVNNSSNPNYRLNNANNLSRISYDQDSPPTQSLLHPSFNNNNNNNDGNMQTIVEVNDDEDDNKYNIKYKKIQNVNIEMAGAENNNTNARIVVTTEEGDVGGGGVGGDTKHVYKTAKKRTKSTEKAPNEIVENSPNKDQSHLYTTQNSSK